MNALLGLLRSAVVYWRPGRQAALRRLYAPFVRPGDLVFDFGAHLGDRTMAFADLGARVVALEPQPRLRRWLLRRVGRRPEVTVLGDAAGPEPGRAMLAISTAHPTVSTLATDWRERVAEANPNFRRVRWDDAVEVTVTTLDALAEEHGEPAFVKIDVEGFEARVLAGLTRPVAGLSVEFVSGTLDIAVECVRRMEELGDYRWQAIRGEKRRWIFEDWRTPGDLIDWLASGADGAPSGDLYARRIDLLSLIPP
jgi:FkbM family methyltransferase